MAYFHSNYGQLKDVDTSGITQGGQAWGNMFQQLGKTAATALEKYREGKEKKEKQEDFKDQLLRQYKAAPENPIWRQFGITTGDEAGVVFKDLAKNPETMKQVIGLQTFMQQADKQKGMDEVANIFLNQAEPTYTDPTGTYGQTTGLPAIDRFSGDPKAFLESVKRSGKMPKTDAGRQQLAGIIERLATTNAAANRQEALTTAGREPTREDELDVELKEQQLKEKKKEENETQNRVTDLLTDTTFILDKIAPRDNPQDSNSARSLEGGTDVTGGIEGTGLFRWLSTSMGSNQESEAFRRQLEKYANQFTLENVNKLKGPLSEKELAFIMENAPKITDEPIVWVTFLTDIEKKLNRSVAGGSPSTGQPLDSDASDESMTELERLRKLREERGLAQ
jgi:hypothetical protein